MIFHTVARGLDALPDAKQIRQHVFVEEQGFQKEFDEVDASAIHIVVYDGETPVATGRAFPKDGEEGTYLLGRIAVEKAYRGKNLGTYVIEKLEDYLLGHEAPRCFELSAQCRVQAFYEKLGYCATENRYMDEFCPHVEMRKVI